MSEQARVIAGRYELKSLIGEGGMASVWRALDLTLEREVAVKLLFARDERDKQRLVQQFVREARIAASVQHRNVIHIVDFGTTDATQPFMVMELLEGETLGQRMHHPPPLPLAEIVQIAALTLRGLAAVHDAGIIHRDLKPDNVFLTRDGAGGPFPKILDFGISRSVEPRSGRRSALTTREGMIVGTPEYMSPEQARGVRSIDKRADIYAVGAILYEVLTGKLPFASENVGDLIIQIVTGSVEPVHVVNPKVPVEVSEVVAKAMARKPEDRYPDALAMQQALIAAARDVLDGRMVVALSDAPPRPASEQAPMRMPRVSGEQPRTLEFAQEAAPPLTVRTPSPLPALAPAAAGVGVVPPTVVRTPPPDALGKPRSKIGLWLAALSMAALAGLLILRGSHSQSPGEPRTALGATAALTTRAPAPSAPSAEPEQAPEITVSLRNVPSSARVFVDGDAMPGDTFQLPRDSRNRVIKVTAPGKIPWQAVHHASADASYDVALVDAEPRTRPSHASHPAEAARAVSPGRTHKKPPSALRTPDF